MKYRAICAISIIALGGMRRAKHTLIAEPIQATEYLTEHETKETALSIGRDKQSTYCQTNKDKPCLWMPHQQAQAARIWLQLVQLAGADNKFWTPYYEQSLQSLFALSPYRVQVHYQAIILGLHSYDMTQDGDISFLYEQGKKLIPYLCDQSAIDVTLAMTEEQYIQHYSSRYESGFNYPCKQYDMPALLGFIAYHYQENINKSIDRYRLASLSPDALDTFVHMPALLTARYDDRLTSLVLRYQRLLAIYDKKNTEQNQKQLNDLLEQADYITDKMLETATLYLLEQTAIHYECEQNIDCVYQHIVAYTSRYDQLCETPIDIQSEALCFLWRSRKDEIQHLYHPNGSERFYQRRADMQDRGIQFISGA